MKKYFSLLSSIFVVLLLSFSVVAYDAWPGDSGTRIATGYEFSGAVWDADNERLYTVHDQGYLIAMDADGSDQVVTEPKGSYDDIEGVTLSDERPGYVYIIDEHRDSIKEVKDGYYTGKEWTLTNWLQGPDNYGAEAVTWIPAGHHNIAGVSTGVFAVGLQADGAFYFFTVNFDQTEDLTYHGKHAPKANGNAVGFDLSGSHYDAETETLYAVFDAYNLLVTMQVDDNGNWETVSTINLVGDSQEGIALMGPSSVFIAEDSEELWRYDDFPLGYDEVEVDTDGDGLSDDEESTLGTDPTDDDSDNDKLTDGEEVLTYGTNPLVKDTDGDTFSDWKEIVKHETDPLDADDRRAEKVLEYSYDETSVSLTLASERDYVIEDPFANEDLNEIIYVWLNKWERSMYVTNGDIVNVYHNAELIRQQDLGAWKIEDYTVDETTVTVTYHTGYEVTIDPFEGEENQVIEAIWTNTANRVVYVGNADRIGEAYKNGIKFKDFTVGSKRYS